MPTGPRLTPCQPRTTKLNRIKSTGIHCHGLSTWLSNSNSAPVPVRPINKMARSMLRTVKMGPALAKFLDSFISHQALWASESQFLDPTHFVNFTYSFNPGKVFVQSKGEEFVAGKNNKPEGPPQAFSPVGIGKLRFARGITRGPLFPLSFATALRRKA